MIRRTVLDVVALVWAVSATAAACAPQDDALAPVVTADASSPGDAPPSSDDGTIDSTLEPKHDASSIADAAATPVDGAALDSGHTVDARAPDGGPCICGARKCGVDPVCGISCGRCASDRACMGGGCIKAGPAVDPGFGTGTWLPPGTTDLWVVDQSGANGAGNVTAFPGCVNQTPNTVGCSPSFVDRGMTFTFGNGKTLAIRYRTNASPQAGQYFMFSSGIGAAVSAVTDMALSTTPGDLSPAAPCRAHAVLGSNPTIIIGATACPVAPNTAYYLNVRVPGACTGYACTFKVTEPLSMSQ